ncbi:MAG TPA: class I SAM-dependent methyltransferase [Pyrinomonadaceae bacterium]|nr:class I SAM-dependent methyltransferase [Pyrinomonadaceae bacterium]
MSSIKDKWEYYGENDPYFAVVTFDKYKRENLSEELKNEFFQGGADHFVKIWETIESRFTKNFKPKKALDFGCGVGRLVVPLSERSESVIGIDISEKMLDEARLNCKTRNIENTEFFQTDEFFNKFEGEIDFLHSFIVFQHINPQIGETIIKNLLKKLSKGGIGALHVTYFNSGSKFNWFKFRLYRDYPIINWIKNIIKGTKQEPFIPMHLYDLNSLFAILQENGCQNCFVKFSDHGFYGAVIFFQKEGQIEY